jgi:hypothetical protein
MAPGNSCALGGSAAAFPSASSGRGYFQSQVKSGNLDSSVPGLRNLSNYLRAGECAIDVGASIGHLTLRMADLVGAAGKVIAFEPDSRSFERLWAYL